VEDHDATPGHGEGLGRWLLGGLLGGAVILGLLVGAYTVGTHRGDDSPAAAPAQTAPPAATTTAPAAPTSPAAAGPVAVTPALVASGKGLYASNGCVACHSLAGADGAGPALDGAAGRQVELEDGTTVTADDAYLRRAIADPDAEIVKGYRAGVMSAAISGFGLDAKPDDVDALVAYLKSQK
jgi:mono/diheme cytochrome c family protein